MNARREPSGEKAGSTSASSRWSNRFSEPSAARIQMREALPVPRTNAIEPSGAVVGALSGSVESVMRSGAPATPSAPILTRQSA